MKLPPPKPLGVPSLLWCLKNGDALADYLATARALGHLSVSATLGGVTSRLPVQWSERNALLNLSGLNVSGIAPSFPAIYLTMPTQLIDGTTTPYASQAIALAALAAQSINCLVEIDSALVPVSAVASLSHGGTQLDAVFSDAGNSRSALASVQLDSPGAIKLDYDLTLDAASFGISVQFYIYELDGTTLVGSDSFSGSGASATGMLSVSVPSTGPYFAFVVYGSGPPATTMDMTLAIRSSASVLNFATIRAAWDVGGGVNYEACTP